MFTLDDPAIRERRLFRIIAFGLATVIALGTLTARLAYLQLAGGGHYASLAANNMTVLQAIPSPRGLIYDRTGRLLVANVPSFAVKIRPADLPLEQRDAVVQRLAGLLNTDPVDINLAIDSNPGSRFDLVRIATDVPEATARIISESHLDLPGVEVAVEARRDYLLGPLVSQIIGYTGAISGDQLQTLRQQGYQPDDMLGEAGVEAVYESQLRGTYGVEQVERDALGRKIQVLSTVRPAAPGDSLELTIDTREQQLAQRALTWGLSTAGLTRGVLIVMNPQTGEVLALVSLPTYDDNLFARGISRKDFQALLANRDHPLLNHAINTQYAPGSTFKIVTGTGALADGKITPSTELVTRPYLTLGSTKYWDWNHIGFGSCNIYCGFGNSSDTFFYQVAGMLGIDRLAHWAKQFGFGAPTGVDLPGEVGGIIPTDQWKMDTFGQPIYPGEVYQAGIGQGYDDVTPLQLINAYAALANGGKLYQPQVVRRILGPDGSVVRDFQPQLIRTLDASPSVLRTMREATRNVQLIRHTNNLVDMPIVVAGKTGVAEFGIPDKNGVLPYHTWFVAFVPKNPWKKADDPQGIKAVDRTDASLVVLAFAYDSRTLGNASTEIVKYYLQLHFGIKEDFRKPVLLVRSNFYQGAN